MPYVLALTCATATPLTAQLMVGAGPTFPAGDFSSAAQTGWMAMAGITPFALGPIKIRIEGDYGENKSDVSGAPSAKLYGGMASGVFGLGLFYLMGSAGYLNFHVVDDDWQAVWGGGAGVSIGLGSLHVFGEARYLSRDNVNFVPIMVGVKLGK
jgi:hypothetical protein